MILPKIKSTFLFPDVQEKGLVQLAGNQLKYTKENEQGMYILKPASAYHILKNKEFMPANEHLTMQLAHQLFRLDVAENVLVFFSDNRQAYLQSVLT